MVKRRITLSSQEMNDITNETSTLKTQLDLSNQRVDELENGLVVINKFINKETKPNQDIALPNGAPEIIVIRHFSFPYCRIADMDGCA